MVLGSHKQSDTSRQLLNALYLLRSVTLEPGHVNYTTFELNPRLVTMIYSLLSIIIISPINLPFEVAPGRALHCHNLRRLNLTPAALYLCGDTENISNTSLAADL